jgi:hypothetical protein
MNDAGHRYPNGGLMEGENSQHIQDVIERSTEEFRMMSNVYGGGQWHALFLRTEGGPTVLE